MPGTTKTAFVFTLLFGLEKDLNNSPFHTLKTQKQINYLSKKQIIMKKKIFALSTVALFAIGLAFYANNSSSVDVLSENNVEALTDGEGYGTYAVFGTYPNRIIVDNITHIVTFEGKTQDRDKKDKPRNACADESGGTCSINTTTTVYNIGIISGFLHAFFDGMQGGSSIIEWIESLF